MIQYALLAFCVSCGGGVLSVPALLLDRVLPGCFVVTFLACAVVFMAMENWTLMQDVNAKAMPLDHLIRNEQNHVRIIGEMSVQNSMLAATNQKLADRRQRLNLVSLEAMHWSLLAHKALAINEIGRIRPKVLPRITSCHSI